jgi:signal transduction histidine kinase
MQRSADRNDGFADAIDQAFADRVFAAAKARCAAFAIVRTDSREVVWANAPAAAFWGSRDVEDLARVLFGPPEATDRGWLGSLAGGFVPGRAPQLARPALGRGLGTRDRLVLGRSWLGSDGESFLGFVVPQTGTAHDHSDTAWRRGGTASSSEPEAAAQERDGSAPVDGLGAEPSGPEISAGLQAPGRPVADAELSLARRSQLAILRDRLNAAVDGTASLRLLWRTDRDDVATQIDDRTFTRLGSPVRFAQRSFPEVVAGFDPVAAERLRAALATRATWSGVSVCLPVADGALEVPMVLSASPMFDLDRTFAGYRGFGTVDLGQLGLAPQPSRPVEQPVAAPVAPSGGANREPAVSAMMQASAQIDEPASPGIPEDPVAPAAAPQRSPSANVVPLRRFPAPTLAEAAPHPQPAGNPLAEAVEPSASSTDELAFLALGDALRAHIDSGPPQDFASEMQDASTRAAEAKAGPPVPSSSVAPAVPPGGETAGPETAAGDPAAREPVPDSSAASLIDQLPTALLVFVGRTPVAANRAASDLLDYAAPADLVQAGDGLVISGASRSDTGPVTLRNAMGEAIIVEAAKVGIGWQGAVGTLWTLVPHPRAEPQPATGGRPTPDDAEATAGDLLDHVDDAVALLDPAGRIRRMNRRGESWFGPPGASGVLGRSFMDVLAPDSRAAGLALLADARSQSGPGAVSLRREVLVRTADHVPLPMLLTMGRVGASEFYATLRDLSALKRAETDRARTGRERDTAQPADFLAKVSHEIRTPLNAILGFAEVIMDERFGPLGNPRYKDYLKDIHASGTQVMTLVSDLLDLSRIQAGQLDLDVGAVDVNKIVTETVAQMQPEAHRERVIMRTSLGHRIPAVLADERSARQIVHNLLSNAVRFNEPGGQVIVSTALSDAGTVVLRVRDTGIGMTDAEIATALEPFQQVSSPGSTGGGSGLGLPLTRALIGANGASMAIRSRPREGTLVEVAFASAMPEATRRPA